MWYGLGVHSLWNPLLPLLISSKPRAYSTVPWYIWGLLLRIFLILFLWKGPLFKGPVLIWVSFHLAVFPVYVKCQYGCYLISWPSGQMPGCPLNLTGQDLSFPFVSWILFCFHLKLGCVYFLVVFNTVCLCISSEC